MKKENEPELRVNDIYATKRCLEALIALTEKTEKNLNSAIMKIILNYIKEMIVAIESGKIKTENISY